MRLHNIAIWGLTLLSTVIEAAPTPVHSLIRSTAFPERGEMEEILSEYTELYVLQAKHKDYGSGLATREYAAVTNVLEAIKNTDVAPIVLKSFVANKLLSNLAIEGILVTAKSGVLSAKSLLSLLVQSGLITSVLNDVLGNCEIYVSLGSIGESLLKNLLKREEDAKNIEFLTYQEGLALLQRDGLLANSESFNLEDNLLEARDIDSVVINLMESLASSGLATQVVEALLTDPNFVPFGAKLISALYLGGLLKIGPLVSAVTESGLLPSLMKELLNFSTLQKIARTAISAATGKCSTKPATMTTKTGLTTTKLSSSLPTKNSGNSSNPSGVKGILGNLFGDGTGGSTKPVTTAAGSATSSAGNCQATMTHTVYVCSTF